MSGQAVLSEYSAVEVLGNEWTCRCCGKKFKGNTRFEEHLSVK